MDPILDPGPGQGQVDGLRACGMMEAKIMKYHVLSWFIGKILEEDQDRAELLMAILLPEQVKN